MAKKKYPPLYDALREAGKRHVERELSKIDATVEDDTGALKIAKAFIAKVQAKCKKQRND